MTRHPVRTAINKWARRLHRWGAILILVPSGVVIGAGLLLQLKKDWAWIQPPTVAGAGEVPSISFDEILAAARGVPEAEIDGWDDVDRLDVRPDKGMVKVQAFNRWEVQVDTATGAVLQVAYRRSDLIESIHDGSWFHDKAKLWVFLPNGAVLLGLWLSGAYLWALPYVMRRRGRIRRSAARARRDAGG